MNPLEQIRRLHEIVEPICGSVPDDRLSRHLPPFDISREAMHDTKAAFLIEKEAVERALVHAEGLFEVLKLGIRSDDQASLEVASMLEKLDRGADANLKPQRPNSTIDLVAQSAGSVGFSLCLARMVIEAIHQLKQQEILLKRQEKEFWNVSGRPPNHHARNIALRFARHVARATGRRPTVGKSSEGNFPSTEYSRALEQIFMVLEIEADFRRAGNWAVKQLKPEDYRTEPRGLLDMIGQMSVSELAEAPHQAIGHIAKQLDKSGGQ